ncbi:MAG: hypothetical protein KIH69_020675 [Anaerolineae bacterium]|nr:hypothetical protein [Anaerolineae bacterium]
MNTKDLTLLIPFIIVSIASIAGIAALLRKRGWGGWKVSLAASATAYIVVNLISLFIIAFGQKAFFGGRSEQGGSLAGVMELIQIIVLVLPVTSLLIYGGIFRLFHAAPSTRIASTALLAWLISLVIGGLLYLTIYLTISRLFEVFDSFNSF